MPPADPTQTVEVTCPGCFHPQQWDATAACPMCHHRANVEGRSGALLPVGTQLKGYVIGEKLGQGGFGITYRGFDVTLKMKVAIKEYYPSEMVGRSTNRKAVLLNGQDHEDRFQYGLKTFLKEAQTIAQLRHPHLVRVLNYFELNDTAYLVMDYLEGEDLAKHLKPPKGQRGIQMPWRRAVKLLLPVLDGLQKVHQAGFMHRDLKPGNLYLTKDDELMVLDFGSARQVTSNHTRSLLIFSEGYAPYEQYLQGHLTRQGPWTDVYAIAATLYFMLTGCRLPSAMDRKQAQLLQQPDPLKPARHFVPELPAALDAVLMRALVVEPELRLPTVVDLKQQLERVLAQAEPVASPELASAPVASESPKPLLPEPELPKPIPVELPPASPPPRPEVASEPTHQTTPALRATPPYPRRGTSHSLTWMVIVAIMIIGLVAGGVWWFGFRTPIAPVAATPPMTAPVSVVEPAPQPKPTLGTLVIRSDPPGATIRVNGVFLGVAPQDFKHTEGAVEIDAALEGYQRRTESVQVRADESQTVFARLTPNAPTTGTLTIRSDPPGATIRVNGVFLGVAPQEVSSAGTQTTVTATLDAYQATEESVWVRPGQHRDLVMTLRPVLPPVVAPPPTIPSPPMVKITGGCFEMGSPAKETGREPDEMQHRVCVSDFELAPTELTVGEFKRFATATGYQTDAEKDTGYKGCYASSKSGKWEPQAGLSWRKPGYKQGDDYPVACVSWNDVQAYTQWLSQQTGQGYRLPTEAEWEYAARAGTTAARHWGDSPKQACQYANVADRAESPTGLVWTDKHECSDGYWYPAPVRKFRPNPWGLYDMMGNVWEWTCSAYDKDYGVAEKECSNNNTVDPLAVRGGGWNDQPARVRSAYRAWNTPANRGNLTGFRLARYL